MVSFKKELEINANKLPFDYKKCFKFDLVLGYFDDIKLSECYFSALLLRYWHETTTLGKEIGNLASALHLTFNDIVDLYIDSMMKVLDYIDLSKYIDKPKDQRDKMLNSYVYGTIDTMRINFIQYHSYDKRKINIEAISLDNVLDEDGNTLDAKDENDDYKKTIFYSSIDIYITKYVHNGYFFEALLLYFLVYDDLFVYKSEKDINSFKYSFTKLLNAITSMSNSEIKAFCDKYDKDNHAYDYYVMLPYYYPAWIRVLQKNALKRLRKNDEIFNLCVNSL